MPPSKGSSINPLWPHYIAAVVLALTLATGFLRFTLFDWSDPFHCRALLNSGQWIDSKFQNWQPEGCMMHLYKPADISTCLDSRRVVFIGDSVTRQLFFALAHASDGTLPSAPPSSNEKHSDYFLTSKSGIEFSFVWSPYLNRTLTSAVFGDESSFKKSKPALLVMGSGLWYLRYADKAGGMAAWEATIESTFDAIKREMPSLADEVVFLPVEQPTSSKLSQERAKTIHTADIDAMNSELAHRISPRPSSKYPNPFSRTANNLLPISLPLVFNKMLDASQTDDGLHYSQRTMNTEVNLLLNLRCNNVLSSRFPYDKTCCRRYPNPPFIQVLVLAVVLLWGPLTRFLTPQFADRPRLALFFPREEYIMPMSNFGLAIGLTYIADRTGIWLKEQKQFDGFLFGSSCIIALVVGLLSLKKGDKDLGFLNREQTDEWKGWMQIAILIYHYLGASKISGIYNPIRVLVAAYLFMTGYGHVTFYMKKADFGFLRIAQVLVRLNLLTIVLSYTMNTDYLFYYFAPLVSLWFIIIYFTMLAGAQYNDRTPFLITKFFISMALVTFVMSQTWLLEDAFKLLETIFHIKWSAKEWAFRVNLDLWVVYAGMFTSLAYIKFRESRIADHPHWNNFCRVAIVASVLTMVWFFSFELSQPSKFTYNAWHPYISFLPVGAFVILRNSTPILRSASSRLFSFIGTCSLETFILQYHIWLAGDTKGILLVIPGTRWRPVNMVLSTIIFIWISHKVATATGQLTNWICGVQKKALPVIANPPGGQPSAPTAPEEAIPLVSQLSEDGSTRKQAEPDANGDVTGQPSTSQQRWVDRLASTPHRPGFRIFRGDGFKYGPAARVVVTLVFMWLINLSWPNSA